MSEHFSDNKSDRSACALDSQGSAVLHARVIAAHGQLLRVRTNAGEELLARPLGREQPLVCGDYVRCAIDVRHEELRVVALRPRASALFRSNAHGRSELIAANVSLLIAVVAPLPIADFFIVDRYLCAAQCAGIGAAVLLNKCELSIDAAIEEELRGYARRGIATLRVSALSASGLPELRMLLAQHTAVLVGQSGVGKSSLLRALLPQAATSVGALIGDDEGRHTTSATRLYALPSGGQLIDSPGVRDFAPAIDRLHAPALGFTEISALSAECRFTDCRHLREPDCAVRRSLGDAVSARRYESYRRLLRLCQRLQGPQAPRASRPKR